MSYVVKTQDVDGSSRREYKTAGGAVKRFEAMLGLSLAKYREFEDKGPCEYIYYARGVSKFGTVVSIETPLAREAVALAQFVYPPVPTPEEKAKALSDEELVRQQLEAVDAIAWGEAMSDPGESRLPVSLYNEAAALTDECYARALPGYKPAPFEFPTSEFNPRNKTIWTDGDLPF